LPEYVVDTSVAVKWVVGRNEPDVREAQQLLLAFQRRDCTLSSPDLLFVEFANALTTGQRRALADVRQAVGFLHDLGIRVAPLSWSALNRAIEIAVSNRVTVYDSYFLAVAESVKGTLVTADDKFLRRIGPNANVIALRDLRLAG
jgi:predicted nucleic acid-binding protein